MVRVKVSHGEGEDRRIIRIHLETMTPALLRGFFGVSPSKSLLHQVSIGLRDLREDCHHHWKPGKVRIPGCLWCKDRIDGSGRHWLGCMHRASQWVEKATASNDQGLLSRDVLVL